MEPCRRAYSLEEITAEARAFMVENYGKPSESSDPDRWHERLGMLVSFLHDKFPKAG